MVNPWQSPKIFWDDFGDFLGVLGWFPQDGQMRDDGVLAEPMSLQVLPSNDFTGPSCDTPRLGEWKPQKDSLKGHLSQL